MTKNYQDFFIKLKILNDFDRKTFNYEIYQKKTVACEELVLRAK